MHFGECLNKTWSKEAKYLGVILDPKHYWKRHVESRMQNSLHARRLLVKDGL